MWRCLICRKYSIGVRQKCFKYICKIVRISHISTKSKWCKSVCSCWNYWSFWWLFAVFNIITFKNLLLWHYLYHSGPNLAWMFPSKTWLPLLKIQHRGQSELFFIYLKRRYVLPKYFNCWNDFYYKAYKGYKLSCDSM